MKNWQIFLEDIQDTKVSILKCFAPKIKLDKEYILTREIISVETVEYKKVGEDAGYIKITSFSKTNKRSVRRCSSRGSKRSYKVR